MKYVSGHQSNGRRFMIERDESVGFYLYVYEDDRCVRDHLQDSLELAVQQAFEEFSVPKDSWQRAED
ncbi:MAG: hypothetical protein AB1490_14685 [Pseudomonadota bacterium]